MKKIFTVLFVASILLVSCSKESKLNRKLDGEWNCVTYDGIAPTAGQSLVVKFDKDKKGKGNMTWTFVDAGVTDVDTYSYVLVEDKKIIFTGTGSTAAYTDTLLVKSHSKKDLTITDVDGNEPIVLKKK